MLHIEELRQRATRGQSAGTGGGTGGPVPLDGLASVSYDEATNRISTSGWEYDFAGSQTRIQGAGGAGRRVEYDAAGRMVKVKTDAGGTVNKANLDLLTQPTNPLLSKRAIP